MEAKSRPVLRVVVQARRERSLLLKLKSVKLTQS